MNGFFLCEQRENIIRAYSQEQIAGRPILTWEEFKQNPFQEAEFIFSTWGMPALTREEINTYLPGLEAVFYAAGTVQYFVRPFLEAGVRVFSAWKLNGLNVAEFTVAQIILANKGYFRLHNLYQRSYEEALNFSLHFPGNYGATVGLLGAGAAGRYVIELLKPYDLTIWVYDPFLPDEQAAELGVLKKSLEEIFSHCAVISNHLANNERTKGILTYALFSRMKEYATFINTGRGAQIDGDALLTAMCENRTRTALLDVTDPIEPLPSGSPYLSQENIFVSPHRAGCVNQEIRRMGLAMMEEQERLVSGKPVRYEVLSKMLEVMA